MRLTAGSWQITSFVFRCWQGWWGKGWGGGGGKEAIGNGWGCLSYLSGVKISDLVPFTVSQTSVDYKRPNWYFLGCFSLNKMPELCISRTILMIWLEPLEHIDKGVLRCFKLFYSSKYLTSLRSNISRSQKATTLILITLYNPLFHLWKSSKKYLGTTVFLSWIPFKICDSECWVSLNYTCHAILALGGHLTK